MSFFNLGKDVTSADVAYLAKTINLIHFIGGDFLCYIFWKIKRRFPY